MALEKGLARNEPTMQTPIKETLTLPSSVKKYVQIFQPCQLKYLSLKEKLTGKSILMFPKDSGRLQWGLLGGLVFQEPEATENNC